MQWQICCTLQTPTFYTLNCGQYIYIHKHTLMYLYMYMYMLYDHIGINPWWRNEIKTLSPLLAPVCVCVCVCVWGGGGGGGGIRDNNAEFPLLLAWIDCWTKSWVTCDLRIHITYAPVYCNTLILLWWWLGKSARIAFIYHMAVGSCYLGQREKWIWNVRTYRLSTNK